MKYFLTTVIVIIVVAVGAGLWFAGSPKQVRLQQFDQRRVMDLQMIQSELYTYWSTNKKLPDSLAVFDGKLTNGYSSFIPPMDPETGTAYEYAKKAEDTFTLCATFNLKSDADSAMQTYSVRPGSVPDSWAHDAGRICFERIFDTAGWAPTDAPVK